MRKYRNVVTIPENKSLYGIWRKMIERCTNEKCERYKDYGERGIKVFEEWLNDFDNFADWSHCNGYSKGLSIDRIDNNGNYEPSNCRWATVKEQNRNKRQTIYVEYNGERKPLITWCEELNLPYDAIHNRIFGSNWDVDKALSTPIFDNKKSFNALCRSYNMNPGTVRDRVEKFGWSLEDALTTPTYARGISYYSFGEAKCKVCGTNFTKSNPRKIYCSEKCYKKSKRVSYKKQLLATEV